MPMNIEPRSQRRYEIRQDAYAVFKPEPAKFARILEIGMGGLTISSEFEFQPNSASELEIFADDCSFYMDKVPYKLSSVSVLPMASRPHSSPKKHFAIRFENLTARQRSQLRYFIRHYTTGAIGAKIARLFSKLCEPFRRKRYGRQSCSGIWQENCPPSP